MVSTPTPFPLEPHTARGWGNRRGWFLSWPWDLAEQPIQTRGCRWDTPHLGAQETQLPAALLQHPFPTVPSSWVSTVTLSTKSSSSLGGRGLLGSAAPCWH